MADDKIMVNDVEGVQSLGGREMLNSIGDGICVCVTVLVLVVVVGVPMLVGVLCIGVVEVNFHECLTFAYWVGFFWWRWWNWSWWWGMLLGCGVRMGGEIFCDAFA